MPYPHECYRCGKDLGSGYMSYFGNYCHYECHPETVAAMQTAERHYQRGKADAADEIARLTSALETAQADLAWMQNDRNKWQDSATQRHYRTEKSEAERDTARAETSMAYARGVALRETQSTPQEAEPVAWPGPGRFTDLPKRLRRCAEIVATGAVSEGQVVWIVDVVVDAALKIEALERDNAHPTPAPAATVETVNCLPSIVLGHAAVSDEPVHYVRRNDVLAALRAQPAPQDKALEVPDGLIEALRNGGQADMDGTTVKVSRQACEMAADILSNLVER